MKRAAFAALACTPLLLGAGKLPPHKPPPATARPMSSTELYVAGRYVEAIAAGIAANNAEGFTIAARAELAQEQARISPCLDCLSRAEGFARKAIAADPKLPDGHIYVAVSLGYEARIVGIIEARLKGYAEEAKEQLDEALKLDPDNAWALAALAGWNIEIVRNGGDTLAEMIYGATVANGLSDFARAFKLQPNNLVLRYQYSLTMSGFDLDTYRHDIEDALNRAASGKQTTANDALTKSRAQILLKLLHAGNDDAYIAQVRKFQGYP
jgi:tetratricopeptide (TPR) repeat protein